MAGKRYGRWWRGTRSGDGEAAVAELEELGKPADALLDRLSTPG